jgi:hypothetical protein
MGFEAYEDWFALLGIFSVLTFVGSLVLVPFIILNLPVDYFVRQPTDRRKISVGRALLHLCKNMLGGLFVLMGLLMLVLPGQGVLSLLLGFSMIDFPAKRRIQISILSIPRVRKAVNWIRIKGKRSPIEIPASDG